MTKAVWIASIVAPAFGLLLFGTLPATAQKIYYEAPLGQAPFAPGKGAWTIRKDLTLPTANKPAYLPYKELINEGPPGNDQKYLGFGRSYGGACSPHVCAPTYISLILWFAPKATANLKLIFETTTPVFHALGEEGGPIWIGTPPKGPDYHVYPDNANYARVWNTGHHSKNNMSIAAVRSTERHAKNSTNRLSPLTTGSRERYFARPLQAPD